MFASLKSTENNHALDEQLKSNGFQSSVFSKFKFNHQTD